MATPVPTTTAQPLTVQSFGLSHPGRVRSNNEDVFLTGELARTLLVRHTNLPQPDETHGRHRGHVFLVADGVGGNEAGEVASRLGTNAVEGFLLNSFRRFTAAPSADGQPVLRELQAALREADARLFEEVGRHPEWWGMGTTLTVAVVAGRRLFVAHAGDSRCYLHSAGVLRQLTTDHTVAAEMVRTGLLTPAQQDQHPWRHVLTNLVGGSDPGVRAEVHLFDLHPGEALLLCTDQGQRALWGIWASAARSVSVRRLLSPRAAGNAALRRASHVRTACRGCRFDRGLLSGTRRSSKSYQPTSLAE